MPSCTYFVLRPALRKRRRTMLTDVMDVKEGSLDKYTKLSQRAYAIYTK